MDTFAPESVAPRHNVPAELNSFVGRAEELVEIEHLLGTTRLLTLVGTGGVGKTRLAQRLASQLLDRYADGVWWIELATVVDADLLPYAVAVSLHLREPPGRSPLALLMEHLQLRRLLLVFDNCEHQIAGSANLSDTLLRACPDVQILATSREPLAVPGEIAWRVPSLSLPWPLRPLPVDAVAQSEAVRLFVERAREVMPGFAATEENTSAIARVCYRLDGLPLAVELAATRVTVLTPEQIADELDHRFVLLVGGRRTALPRHQTLQAAFDWSFDLLTESERAVLRRLATFTGAFGLEQARAVCAAGEVTADEVLDVLARLVNKSLVAAEVHSPASRFHLLESVQQYAATKLQESGETRSTAARHLRCFLDLAERSEPEQRTRDQILWLNRLELEHENITAALEWSLTDANSAESGLRLATALRWFWSARGYPSEGLLWLKRGLSSKSPVAERVRAKALNAAGALCHSVGELAQAEDYLNEALGLWRTLDDDVAGMGVSLNTLGLVAKAQGLHPRAEALLGEALNLARQANDAPRLATVLNNLAALAIDRSDYASAELFLGESLSIKRALGDAVGIASSLHNLGDAALHQGAYAQASLTLHDALTHAQQAGVEHVSALSLHSLGLVSMRGGDLQRAGAFLKESLALFRELGDASGVALCAEGLAESALARGTLAPAVTLLAASAAWRKANDFPVAPYDRSDHERMLATARSGLKTGVFREAWTLGYAMSLEQALEGAPASEPESPPDKISILTHREREVAGLVAQGLSNRDIASKLYIAPATAALHVEHIRAKLGFHSRAQIAAWIGDKHTAA
jgi:predicted ATPase/DNA-binding CsgD family transcriptional regulator